MPLFRRPSRPVDMLSKDRRSAIMALVKSKDTKPEMAVRRIAHAMGLRYKLHRRDLVGTPDLVFPKYKTALFVHGCFWHRHPSCRKATMPKSNVTFWAKKFENTVVRDVRNQEELEREGWKVCIIWECETKEAYQIEIWLRETFPLKREEEQNAPWPKKVMWRNHA